MGRPKAPVGASEFQRSAGQRLTWLRETAEMTQDELAQLLGVSQDAISRWENGSRMLSPYYAMIIGARFQVSFDYLYLGLLRGVHPDLAKLLKAAHPELVLEPTDMPWRRGRGPA
jgi:transcriptional regulator with XRE-family HTH domain